MIHNPLPLAAFGVAAAAFPRAARFTTIGPGAVAITDQSYGVSITATDGAALLLDTGFTDGRVDASYYLTGFGATTHQCGIIARGAAGSSAGDIRGYLLPGVRYNTASAHSGQIRCFLSNGKATNQIDTNIPLPGEATAYAAELVRLSAEIVGTAWQAKVWSGVDEPAWQAGGADITRQFGASTFYWPSGKFGFGFNLFGATMHLTRLSARPISALS